MSMLKAAMQTADRNNENLLKAQEIVEKCLAELNKVETPRGVLTIEPNHKNQDFIFNIILGNYTILTIRGNLDFEDPNFGWSHTALVKFEATSNAEAFNLKKINYAIAVEADYSDLNSIFHSLGKWLSPLFE